MEFRVEDDPNPLDVEFLETQIRREASVAMELGDEVELAIFVRDAGRVVAGISGWTWGDCCELQSLWVEPSLRGRWLGTRLIAAAEAEAAARGCTQTVHFTYDFQARRLYERAGYELIVRCRHVRGMGDLRRVGGRPISVYPVGSVVAASPGGSVDLSSICRCAR